MCGIFGLVAAPGVSWSHADVQHAIRALIKLSEPRGREATGVAVVLPVEIAYFRRPMAPARVLASPDFQRFLDQTLPPDAALRPDTAGFAVLGHCRLVTNGSRALDCNNQPVLLDTVVGVHNGIVTNPETVAAPAERPSPSVGLDSEALFDRIGAELRRGADVPASLSRTFTDLEGEASIGMFARDANTLVLATNTGSLYFTPTAADGLFAFASEAGILKAFLEQGRLGTGSAGVRQLPPWTSVSV